MAIDRSVSKARQNLVFSQQKNGETQQLALLYKRTRTSHPPPKTKKPNPPITKKAVHLETPVLHLGGVAKNRLAYLL